MGCTSSSVNNNVMENNPLSATEIQQRIEAPTESKHLAIGDIKMRYAWVSQRGYYPDGRIASVLILGELPQKFHFSIFFVEQHLTRQTKMPFQCSRYLAKPAAPTKLSWEFLMDTDAMDITVHATFGTM